jgi:hypothetical protein
LSYRIHFGRGLNRQINARLAVEAALASDDAARWRKYLAGWLRDDELPSQGTDHWIVRYLRLRHPKAEEFQDLIVLRDLSRDVAPGLDVHHDFRQDFLFEWFKELALRYAHLGQHNDASRELTRAMRFASDETSELWWKQELRRLAQRSL